MTPFVRRVGSVEIEYWHAAHHACLACDEPSEIRLGDENEWLVYLCASCGFKYCANLSGDARMMCC